MEAEQPDWCAWHRGKPDPLCVIRNVYSSVLGSDDSLLAFMKKYGLQYIQNRSLTSNGQHFWGLPEPKSEGESRVGECPILGTLQRCYDLQDMIDKLAVIYLRVNDVSDETPYFHLLFAGHMVQLILKHGSLLKFHQQSWERVMGETKSVCTDDDKWEWTRIMH